MSDNAMGHTNNTYCQHKREAKEAENPQLCTM